MRAVKYQPSPVISTEQHGHYPLITFTRGEIRWAWVLMLNLYTIAQQILSRRKILLAQTSSKRVYNDIITDELKIRILFFNHSLPYYNQSLARIYDPANINIVFEAMLRREKQSSLHRTLADCGDCFTAATYIQFVSSCWRVRSDVRVFWLCNQLCKQNIFLPNPKVFVRHFNVIFIFSCNRFGTRDDDAAILFLKAKFLRRRL